MSPIGDRDQQQANWRRGRPIGEGQYYSGGAASEKFILIGQGDIRRGD